MKTMRIIFLVVLALSLVCGCRQEYCYRETTDYENESGRQRSFAGIQFFKAKNDVEAIERARNCYLNHSISELCKLDDIIRGTNRSVYSPSIATGYILTLGHVMGKIIKEENFLPGIDHSAELSGKKAFADLSFGMSNEQVTRTKGFENFVTGHTNEHFFASRDKFGGGVSVVRDSPVANVYYSITTLEGDSKINQKPYHISLRFWEGELYQVDISVHRARSRSSREDMLGLRNVLWVAYGIPSSFCPLKMEEDSAPPVIYIPIQYRTSSCSWDFQDKSIQVSRDMAIISNKYIINQMCDSVKKWAEIEFYDQEKKMQEETKKKQEELDKAAALF